MESLGPSINLISVGILFGIAQVLVLLTVLLVKKGNRAHRYFALLLSVLLISQVESFLNRSGLMASTLYVLNIATPFIFLFGPFLYLYIRSMLRKPLTKTQGLIHFMPFVFYLGYSFFFYLQPEAYKYNAFVESFQPHLSTIPVAISFHSDPWNIRGIVVVELLSLHVLAYGLVSLSTLRDFKKRQKEVDLAWLTFSSVLLTIGGTVLFLSQGGIVNGNRFFETFIPNFSADLFPTLATYGISLYLLKNGLQSEIKLPKYYKSGISKELRSSQLEKIINTIETHRLFANPSFSLKLLSDSSGLSTHHISQVLNEELGLTFFELTNRYRIEEAKKLLATTNDYIKMEQLAYDLGYKSKSTFFTAFKKATSLTPLKYQQSSAA